MTTTLDSTTTASTAVAELAAWHAQREEELSTPHGWLSLVGYHWLASTPGTLPGVPGLWWADGDGAHHLPDDAAVVAPDGSPVGTVVVDEGGSRVAGTYLPAGRGATDGGDDRGVGTVRVAVEVVRRTGRSAIRLRDPLAPARTGFAGVPRFAHDPAWVVDAPVRWYDEPRPVVVGAARPGLVHTVRAVGEADVEHDGRTATLVLTAGPGGAVTLLFSDEADDVAPWRVLSVDVPDDATASAPATLRLDLNRTTNLPYAFSDFGTCPAPVPGNHVPFAVTAGERAPR
ncbi:DUF1684 domain-containing protein [Cellulosimicrobium sp. Marseille-Q8652]